MIAEFGLEAERHIIGCRVNWLILHAHVPNALADVCRKAQQRLDQGTLPLVDAQDIPHVEWFEFVEDVLWKSGCYFIPSAGFFF